MVVSYTHSNLQDHLEDPDFHDMIYFVIYRKRECCFKNMFACLSEFSIGSLLKMKTQLCTYLPLEGMGKSCFRQSR